MNAPYIRKLQTINDITIWLVDGGYVRKHFYLDFVAGGHDLRYDFIPKKQIWVDATQPKSEWPANTVHELYERALMDTRMKYNDAHPMACAIEKIVRGIDSQDGKALND
jgi:hypothetical protein